MSKTILIRKISEITALRPIKVLHSEHRKNYILIDNNYFLKMSVSKFVCNQILCS